MVNFILGTANFSGGYGIASHRNIEDSELREIITYAQENDINWDNVWFALKEDYPRAQGLPTPGFAAGPCLVKDTQQLDFYFHNNFELGRSAIKINEHM